MTRNDTMLESEMKFRYFITGLAFSILGLAVETAGTPVTTFGSVIEMLSWLLLFGAALAGLPSIAMSPLRDSMIDVQKSLEAVQKRVDDLKREHWQAMPEKMKVEMSVNIGKLATSKEKCESLQTRLAFLPDLEGYQLNFLISGLALLALAKFVDRVYLLCCGT